MVQFLLTPITACLTPNKKHLKFAKWSQNPSNVTSSSWNTGEGAIKEMGFALSFCSSGHQSTLSNNEIICWKDVHFEDHSLPNCLGHLHGSQGRFKEFLTLVTQIKGRTRCWIWLCVCVCVWFNIWWSFHFMDTGVAMWVLFFVFFKVMQIEPKIKLHSDTKRRKYLYPEK